MEIIRSTQARVDLGSFQARDFFMALKKGDVPDDALPEEIERAAAKLQETCNECVLASLRDHFKARKKIYTDDQIRRMFGIPKPQPEFG